MASAITQIVFKHDVLRYPRLDTILMVEKAAYAHKSDLTIRDIWQSLPKKVMWQSYLTILDYLEYSGKIHIESDKTITWLWNPKLVEKYKNRPDLEWRPPK